jgi:amino-acid N-acetyltransferase
MIRKARLSDVPQIVALVEVYARRGEVLPRSLEEAYQSLREWVVAEENGRIVGCGSLLIMWADLAEIRSLVVAPEFQGRGLGRQLLERLLVEAEALGLPQVFALTRQVDFFANLGFSETARESLPRKIWKDCWNCVRLHDCDEVAVIKFLGPGGNGRAGEGEAVSEMPLNTLQVDLSEGYRWLT